MRPNRLQEALAALGEAIHEVNAAVDEMRREHDALASHIYVARRDYQTTPDAKGGKRHERAARMSWQKACALGFRGQLRDWEQLLGAAPRRD
jgi:hypothetical protein